MVSSYEWFSTTRMIGMASFAASLTGCTARWRGRGGNASRRLVFAILAGVQFVLLLDMAFNWRWSLHQFFMDEAMAYGVYGRRGLPQLIGVLTLAGMAVFSSALMLMRFRDRAGTALAVMGTLLSLDMWCLEVLSFHPVDHVLYSMIGGAMTVSYIWIALSMVTCLGAWLDHRGYAQC